jgi:hypothetical protein
MLIEMLISRPDHKGIIEHFNRKAIQRNFAKQNVDDSWTARCMLSILQVSELSTQNRPLFFIFVTVN